jgi:hypothetical protein
MPGAEEAQTTLLEQVGQVETVAAAMQLLAYRHKEQPEQQTRAAEQVRRATPIKME